MDLKSLRNFDKMRKIACLLAICLTSAAALPQQRITGGSVVNISHHPFAGLFLFALDGVTFRTNCGSTILNNRCVLSAAHCWFNRGSVNQARLRVGSTNASSGGSLHNVAQFITHPNYNSRTQDADIGLVRVTTPFPLGNNVRVGSIAGANFNIPDNTLVWAIGWGILGPGQPTSEQLRQVQLRIINQTTCQRAYGGSSITANMICAGWEAGGRGSCNADSGSPLLHNAVAVGVTSFGPFNCADGRIPGVYVRVSRFTNWIRANA